MITVANLGFDYAAWSLRNNRYGRFPVEQRPACGKFDNMNCGKVGEMVAGTRAVPDLGKLEIRHQNAFAGKVLRVYQQSVQVMSDIWEYCTYAEVWNDEAQRVENFCLGGVNGYDNREYIKADADASDEIQATAAAWKKAKADEAAAERAAREAELEARTFRTGKRVRVARGRKIPIGKEGVIFWMGVDNWGKQKLGIATSERKVGGKFADVQWVAASNCDIIRAQEAGAVA